jgi:hypothetical protein
MQHAAVVILQQVLEGTAALVGAVVGERNYFGVNLAKRRFIRKSVLG